MLFFVARFLFSKHFDRVLNAGVTALGDACAKGGGDGVAQNARGGQHSLPTWQSGRLALLSSMLCALGGCPEGAQHSSERGAALQEQIQPPTERPCAVRAILGLHCHLRSRLSLPHDKANGNDKDGANGTASDGGNGYAAATAAIAAVDGRVEVFSGDLS